MLKFNAVKKPCGKISGSKIFCRDIQLAKISVVKFAAAKFNTGKNPICFVIKVPQKHCVVEWQTQLRNIWLIENECHLQIKVTQIANKAKYNRQ